MGNQNKKKRLKRMKGLKMNNQDQQARIQAQMQHKLHETASRTDPEKCKCGCNIFLSGFQMRSISKEVLMLHGIPSHGDIGMRSEVLYCKDCGSIFEDPSTSPLVKGV